MSAQPGRGVTAFLATVAVGLMVEAAPARAQSISALTATKNAGNSPDNFQDTLTVSFQRTTVIDPPTNDGIVAHVHYKEVVGADAAALSSASDTQSSDYTIQFNVTAPGAYDLNITTSLNGAFTIVHDFSTNDGGASADASAVTGTQTGGTLSGSLSLSDPTPSGPITSGNVAFNRTSTATVQGTSNGASVVHTLRFTWSASCSSNFSILGADECAVRLGIPIGYVGETAGDYPGIGSRNVANDGHFVTVALVSLCGDGVVQGARGEQCDQGAANGTAGSCCTSTCQLRSSSFTCRASAGVCDPAEHCTGASGACPPDVLSPGGTTCRAGSGDACDPTETCTGSSPTCPADVVRPSGFVCRAGSGDSCDPSEVCSGIALQPCPAQVLQPTGTLCRAGSGDACDPSEFCPGVATQPCPANVVTPSGTPCRVGSGDVCDPTETCTGVAGQTCPPDSVAGAFVVCRAGSGDACDPDEHCTGTAGQPCPSNTITPAGTTCRTGSGDLCDPSEACTGLPGAACPSNVIAPNGTVCRAGSGDACDPSESCTGAVGQPCPPNVVTPAGTVCRPGSGDMCDPVESCTGVAGQACPPDSVSGAFVVCRAAEGDCDLAEHCPGTPGQACPANAVKPNGTTCRASAGDCDVAEACDGSSPTCPADAFASSTTVCRPSTGTCDIAEHCTGASATCPADTGLPDTDGDTVCDAIDNCVDIPNTSQANNDADALGDACDPCTNVVPTVQQKAKVTLTKLLAPANDDKLSAKGFFLNVPTTPTIDPLSNGIRFLISDAAGNIPVDVAIPGGAYDVGTRAGWKVNGSGTSWSYKNAGVIAPLVNGITKVQLKAQSTPGKYKWAVKGKNGNYAIDTGNLPIAATLVIDVPYAETGQCGEATFPAVPPTSPSCVSVSGGRTVKCK